MNKNNFDINANQSFDGSAKVKEQLVSEIDVIRDTMLLVSMFMGEPFRIGATLLQELESNKPKNNNE